MSRNKKVQKPLSKNEIKVAIDRFVTTVGDIQALLAKETDCLKRADNENFFKLQNRKVDLVDAYRHQMADLMASKDAIRVEYPNVIPFLQEKREALNKEIEANTIALKRMDASTTRLSERIMDVAREAAVEKASVTYSSGGKLGDKKRASMGLSESA